MPVTWQSELRCPHCDHVSLETMPSDYCLYFFTCPACHTLLRPLPGQCCVFCAYGSVPCPPIQRSRQSVGGETPCCG